MNDDPKNNGKLPAGKEIKSATPAVPGVPTQSAPAGNGSTSAGANKPLIPAPVAPKPATPTPAAAKAAPSAPATPPPPPPPLPEALARLPLTFQGVHYSLRGFHAEATVAPDQVVAAAEQLDKAGFSLDTITGVDWMAQQQMEIVYDYFHPEKTLRVVIRTRVPRDNPELPTISGVFPGANWHERETHDFFGIRFAGHPDLTPFLLPEDATYHPLRKDFTSCS